MVPVVGYSQMDNQEKAKVLVAQYAQENNPEKTITLYDFAIVWYCKTLYNWKALVTKTTPDGMYYEVTYNGHSAETYLDVYAKVTNLCVPDQRV